MIKFLKRVGLTKTVLASVGTLFGIVGAVLTGRLEESAAITPIVTAVLAIFLRDAVAKGR